MAPAQIILSGPYNAATLEDSVQLSPSTTATFTGGTTFTGPSATFGASSGLYWQQVGTLSGKTITQANGSWIYLSGSGRALTLDSATVVNGDVSLYSDGSPGSTIVNQGTLNHSNVGDSGQVYAETFTNQGAINVTAGTLYLNYPSASYSAVNTASGTVTVTGSGSTVYLRGNFDNNGTITAQNSALVRFDGSTTTANLGTIVLATGGRALLDGTVDNTAANLTAPTGGAFELHGGTILNGTIANTAVTFTNGGGYLDGATLTGDLTLGNSTYVRLRNGATFTGTNANFGTNAVLYWEQAGTLAGKALSLGSGSYVYLVGANRQLTLDAASTLTGDVSIYSDGSAGSSFTNQGTLTHTDAVNSGHIYADTFTNEGAITASAGTLYLNYPATGYDAVNAATGTITATGSGTTVYLRGNFDNNGTITAQNSALVRFDGSTTTANLGNVVLATGGRALLDGTVDNTAANLTAPTGGAFELHGGTILNGTIASNALTFTNGGGYLDGATLTGDLTLANNTYVRFRNGGGFSGPNASIGTGAGIYWEQAGTLAGKALTLGAGGYVYLSGTARQLTLDAASTLTGDVSIYSDGSAGSSFTNQGTLTHTDAANSGQIYADTFTNEGAITASAGTLYLNYPAAGYDAINAATGTITATGSGTTVYLRGNFDNNGTITAQNSAQVRFDGSTTTANLGNVVLATGGRALLDGTVDNTAANLAAPTGGAFELHGGTILNGTIANTAVTFTNGGGYLDGATLTGDLTLGNNTYVRFRNGGGFSGPNASIGNGAGIYWEQAGTLAGKALTVGAGGYVYLSGTGRQLTLDAASTLTGDVSIYSDGGVGSSFTNQGTLTHTNASYSGQIYADLFTNEGAISASAGTLYLNYPSAGYDAVNTATGTITATGSGTTVYLRGNFDNNGTITAQNSALVRFDGSNTTANLGNVVLATGGRAILDGTLNNTAATLTAPTGGAFELSGGTIQGGTVASGALTFTNGGGSLDGATIDGDFALPGSTYVYLKNSAGFSGATGTFGASSGIYWQQGGTLAGKNLAMANGSYLYVTGTNSSLTLAADTTVTGDVSIYSDGSSGTAVVNQGTLHHTSSSGSLYAANWTNQGTISASAGSLSIGTTSTGYSFTNAAGASLLATGGTVYLSSPTASPTVNQGLIGVQSGTLNITNTLMNGDLGTIAGAGTIFGDLTLDGGTLSPGNSIGTLTFSSSDFTVTDAAVLKIEVSGASADRITFQNPTSVVNLGAGLLQLSVDLLSTPAPDTSFTIMNISSGGSGFAGYFAGLQPQGSYFSVNYGGTDFGFNVHYLANSITIVSVPEPGTYALMALGLGMVGLVAWRRRRG